jgi:hypothetical protein
VSLAVAEPAHLWVPPGARGNYGDEVADVAELMGRPLDPSQRIAVDAMTSHGPRGRWLALEALIKEPRQNGKTGGVITPIVLTDLFLWPPDRIAWSAHLFKTCREAFADHKLLIDGVPEFRRRVKKITEANGEESIELIDGARIDYLARSKGGGRGLGGKRVVIDEALFFTVEQAGALLPILAAREDPQITYGSSGCKEESTQLRRLTRRGRSGGDPSLILVEFCAPGSFDEPGCDRGEDCTHALGVPGCVLDDPAYWRTANPAMVFDRITIEFLQAMRRTLSPIEFAREFLGWDQGGSEDAEPPITAEALARCVDPDSAPDGSVVFCLDVEVDRGAGAVAVAGRRSDGLPHAAVTDYRPGTSWMVDRAIDLKGRHRGARFVVNDAGPAGSLLADLQKAGLRVVPMNAGAMARACGSLYDMTTAKEPDWRYPGPNPAFDDRDLLAEALAGATWRHLGDAKAWDRRHSTSSISPLVAVTGALWGLSMRTGVPLARKA